MDNMLQMQIIREDTRGLFVPTSIQKLVIDVKKHVQVLYALPDDAKGELFRAFIAKLPFLKYPLSLLLSLLLSPCVHE